MLKLKEGDIFIFQAEKDFISKCIAYITKSDVSHAAMYYKDLKIMEMGASGLCVNKFHECSTGNKVTVMRMKPLKDSMPILSVAESYISSDIKYDYPQLLLLAGLILYWPFRPKHFLKKTIENILKAACLKLDDLLNQLMQKEKKVMMCSQLVYQCYMDCGEDYIIKIENGLLVQEVQNGIRLIDLIKNYQLEDTNRVNLNPIEEFDEEKLAKDLYEFLIKEEDEIDSMSEMESINEIELKELSIYASYFYEKLNLLEKTSNINKLVEGDVSKPLQSLFVTPADLRYHAVNLEKVGELLITRDR